MYLPQVTIRKTRSGEKLSADELQKFLGGFLSGDVADYQVAAWLMAAVLKGLSREETANLTRIMRDSGEVFSWSFPREKIVDKHSTGGVGDKTSLIILPLCVLEGLKVPMMAGRGLGHTGGTLDKLEAVGWQIASEPSQIRRLVETVGGVFMGQTEQIVPLDRRLYALRDVTATVESIPLIVASILSKKLAEGIGNLVMDIKCGSGAFLPEITDARMLANELRVIGKSCGISVSCFITDMGSPLGRCAGNALEVYECLQIMQGGGPQSTRDLSIALATEAILLADPTRQESEVKSALARHLDSGAALEVFKKLGREQGANPKLLDHPESLLRAKYVIPVYPLASAKGHDDQPRHVQSIDVHALGMSIIQLGGGRKLVSDQVDPWVGLTDLRHVGSTLAEDEPLAFVHANDKSQGEIAAAIIQKAYKLTFEPVTPPPLVFEILRGEC